MEIRWLSGLLVGTVFMVAGVAKILFWRRFHDTLAAMELVPARVARIVSFILPPLELAAGTTLFAGQGSCLSAISATSLILAFLFVLNLYRWRGGKELICGCFADFEHKTSTSSLIFRNLALLAAGTPILAGKDTLPREHNAKEWLLSLSIVLGLLLGWTMLSRLVETISLLRIERRAQDLQEDF